MSEPAHVDVLGDVVALVSAGVDPARGCWENDPMPAAVDALLEDLEGVPAVALAAAFLTVTDLLLSRLALALTEDWERDRLSTLMVKAVLWQELARELRDGAA